MITTVDIKREVKTVFSVGNKGPNPEEVILIVGSCRAVAYLNYLHRYNESHGQPFRIHFIDPFNHCFDDANNLVALEPVILGLETNERVLEVLRSTTIYIHEHFKYFGMFNSSPTEWKNIYQFGMDPRLNIAVPNFHDKFVLFSEQIEFDAATKQAVAAGGGLISPGLAAQMKQRGLDDLEKFYSICRLSDFPEMETHMREHWTSTRFFWTANHVSRHFNLAIFRWMNDRFLHLDLNEDFWREAGKEDLFANKPTPVLKEDIEAYGLTWRAE